MTFEELQPPTLAQPARGGEEGESTRVRAATICQRCRFHKLDWANCGEHHCPEWPARESIREAEQLRQLPRASDAAGERGEDR